MKVCTIKTHHSGTFGQSLNRYARMCPVPKWCYKASGTPVGFPAGFPRGTTR